MSHCIKQCSKQVFLRLDAIKRKGYGKEEVIIYIISDVEDNIKQDSLLKVFMTEEELREWEESNAAQMVMGGR